MYKKQGLIEKSLNHFYHSIKIAENINDSIVMADVYTNLGSTFEQQDDLKSAKKYFLKASNIYNALGDETGTAIIFNNLGQVSEEEKDYIKSIEYYTKSKAIWEKINFKNYYAYAINNIGVNLLELGYPDSALVNYMEALTIFKELQNNDDIAWTYNLIGRLYLENKDYKKAEKYLNQGYELTNENDLIDTKKDISENLFYVHQHLGRFKESLFHYKQFIALTDSLNNENTQKALVKQQAKYEYEKQKAIDDAEHEKQLAIEHEAKQKQQILTYATAGGLGLVGIFLIFVFNRLKVTRKQKSIIEEAHSELEEKNKEITDSIQYAKRIQSAILPPSKEYLPDSFILYKPKDIVAGDFYWLETVKDKVLFAAADCTGHGVPGAMVSVVCNNGLNRSVREHNLTEPAKILDKTRDIVVAEFEKSEEEVKDGMDIALCSLQGNQLEYAGAHNPLWIIRNNSNEIEEIKADKQPIGKYENPLPYTTHKIELNPGDTFYIFSDGYADQFGGEQGKKMKTANFKKLLLSIKDENMEQQKQFIDQAFESWKGELEQLDDVCVIGVRI